MKPLNNATGKIIIEKQKGGNFTINVKGKWTNAEFLDTLIAAVGFSLKEFADDGIFPAKLLKDAAIMELNKFLPDTEEEAVNKERTEASMEPKE